MVVKEDDNSAYPIEHPRIPLYCTPDFDTAIHTIEWEPGVHMALGHIDVYYWSPSVHRELMRMWPIVRATLPPLVFTMANDPGPKFHKFVTRLGFRPISSAPCTDGRARTIYCHFKDLPDGR